MYEIDPTHYIQRTHTWFTLEEAQEERAEAKKLYKTLHAIYHYKNV